jgi:hypothetical protein
MKIQCNQSKLRQLLQCKSVEQLDKKLKLCAHDVLYSTNLPVSWDYWHYGRHAEYAESLGLKELSILMSAAWQITGIFYLDARQQKERAKELKRIRLTYEPMLAAQS